MTSRRKLRNGFTVGLIVITFLVFLIWMLASGISASLSLLMATIMALMTAGLAVISYAYKEFLQRRAFSDKKQAGQSTENHQTRTVEIDMPQTCP